MHTCTLLCMCLHHHRHMLYQQLLCKQLPIVHAHSTSHHPRSNVNSQQPPHNDCMTPLPLPSDPPHTLIIWPPLPGDPPHTHWLYDPPPFPVTPHTHWLLEITSCEWSSIGRSCRMGPNYTTLHNPHTPWLYDIPSLATIEGYIAWPHMTSLPWYLCYVWHVYLLKPFTMVCMRACMLFNYP